ncbi:Hypothetical protein Ccan_10120 [Capnocytophaga canimorsus Cc5]|uniref:Uncharacterized protein n=1 Tax=Capnocytophaga canimorsus (strain 5) TaxID=860228 RepID=F9YV83_CAPCC|nr:Hypothetical protein Ccan_10120 [Capnocytophaga canimorsus Cc5]
MFYYDRTKVKIVFETEKYRIYKNNSLHNQRKTYHNQK